MIWIISDFGCAYWTAVLGALLVCFGKLIEFVKSLSTLHISLTFYFSSLSANPRNELFGSVRPFCGVGA